MVDREARETRSWVYHLYSESFIDAQELYLILFHIQSDTRLPSYGMAKDKAEALKQKYPEEYTTWRVKRRLLGEK
jgi:hypothetical protein